MEAVRGGYAVSNVVRATLELALQDAQIAVTQSKASLKRNEEAADLEHRNVIKYSDQVRELEEALARLEVAQS